MNRENLHAVESIAFLFFLVTASIYLASSLLAANAVAPAITSEIARASDLPAVFSGVVLLAAKIMRVLHLDGAEHGAARVAIMLVAGTLLLSYIALDLFAR